MMDMTRYARAARVAMLALTLGGCGKTDGDALLVHPAPDPSEPSTVVAGRTHACALMADRTVRCWGRNVYGQLGDGGYGARSSPAPVPGLRDVAQVAAGGDVTCARLDDGTVRCWGRNDYCQLAARTPREAPGMNDGWPDSASPVPVPVPTVADAREIAVTQYQSCARLGDGTVRCWGHTASSTSTHDDPLGCAVAVASVPGLAGVTRIFASQGGTLCALTADGAVRCWSESYAPLGGGQPAQTDVPPATVAGLTDVVQVAPGSEFAGITFSACALRRDGAVWCWGDNTVGQLGDGTTTARAAPAPVPGITSVARIVSEGARYCALGTDGAVTCWGLSYFFDPAGQATPSPDHCPLFGGLNGLPCSLNPLPEAGLDNAVDLAMGEGFLCAHTDDGATQCRGLNSSGQLGDGTQTNRLAFAPVRW